MQRQQRRNYYYLKIKLVNGFVRYNERNVRYLITSIFHLFQLLEVRKVHIENNLKKLTQENEVLSSKVEKARAELIRLETRNGKKHYPIPKKVSISCSATENTPTLAAPVKSEVPEPAAKKEKKDKAPKKSADKSAGASSEDVAIDVRKLDFRIGKIIDINKHPDADSLYVEKIDCGEENPRTVVSGLVNHIPIEEMRGRIVMVLCNLKPVKVCVVCIVLVEHVVYLVASIMPAHINFNATLSSNLQSFEGTAIVRVTV